MSLGESTRGTEPPFLVFYGVSYRWRNVQLIPGYHGMKQRHKTRARQFSASKEFCFERLLAVLYLLRPILRPEAHGTCASWNFGSASWNFGTGKAGPKNSFPLPRGAARDPVQPTFAMRVAAYVAAVAALASSAEAFMAQV